MRTMPPDGIRVSHLKSSILNDWSPLVLLEIATVKKIFVREISAQGLGLAKRLMGMETACQELRPGLAYLAKFTLDISLPAGTFPDRIPTSTKAEADKIPLYQNRKDPS